MKKITFLLLSLLFITTSYASGRTTLVIASSEEAGGGILLVDAKNKNEVGVNFLSKQWTDDACFIGWKTDVKNIIQSMIDVTNTSITVDKIELKVDQYNRDYVSLSIHIADTRGSIEIERNIFRCTH